MDLGVARKISLFSILLVIITASVIVFVFYHNTNAELAKYALKSLSHQVALESIPFTQTVNRLREDVRHLAESQFSVKQRTSSDTGGAKIRTRQQQLENSFTSTLQNRPHYIQVQYLDAQGQEQVRVDRQGQRLTTTSREHLKNLSNQSYVLKTLDFQKGQIYLSQINLHQEHNHIVEPYIPVLRIATPIFDDKGKNVGLISIVLNIHNELVRISDNYRESSKAMYIANHIGSYLVHPDTKKLFSFDLGKSYRAQEEFPKAAKLFSLRNTDSQLTILPQGDTSRAMIFAKVTYDLTIPDSFIIVGLVPRYAEIIEAQRGVINSSIIWSVILTVVAGLLAYRFSTYLVKPLTQVTRAIEEFMLGRIGSSLPTGRSDEIGVLARSFMSLKDQVESSQSKLNELNQSLEKQVKQRTQELEYAEHYQRTILETVADAIITIDKTNIIRSFNVAAENMFGYGAQEAISQYINILLSKETPQTGNSNAKSPVLASPPIINQILELKGCRKSGEIFPVEVLFTEMENVEKDKGYVVVLHDITERKRVEKMKNEFISTVSHELKTPLTSIQGALRPIVDGKLGKLTEDGLTMLDIASSNAARLKLLIGDILDIQKLESGQMTFKLQDLEITPFIERVVTENSSYGGEHGVSFNITETLSNARVKADPDRLMQVMSNLLSNAAKFSDKGKTVEISVCRREKSVRIAVTDFGAGIPVDFQPLLFQKFSQSDDAGSQQKGGTGLGLSIAKAFIERQGGSIGFSSKAGVGTTFYIDLPEILY